VIRQATYDRLSFARSPNSVTAAVFGLIGVVVGALINGVVTGMLSRRAERSASRSAARLVLSELVRFYTLAVESDRLPPENLPQLRDIAPRVWQSQREILARSLSMEQWELVAGAYARVDALESVLVFDADGSLAEWRSGEAKRLLSYLIGPVEAAAAALAAAAGADHDPVEELRDSDLVGRGMVAA
jgi:hypothetical protein